MKSFRKLHLINIKIWLKFLEYRNGWLIRTTTKSFAVYAATSTEKQEWMAHINKCIEDLLRKSECPSPYNYILYTLHTRQPSIIIFI